MQETLTSASQVSVSVPVPNSTTSTSFFGNPQPPVTRVSNQPATSPKPVAASNQAVALSELTEEDVLTCYPKWFRHQRRELARFFTLSRKFTGHGFPLPLPKGYPYNLDTGGLKLTGSLPAPRYYMHVQVVGIMDGYIEGTRAAELGYRKLFIDTGQVSLRTLQRWRKAAREQEKQKAQAQSTTIYKQQLKRRYQDLADTFPLKVTLALLASGETSNYKLAQLIARSDWSARIYKNILLNAVLFYALREGLTEVLL